MLAAGWCIGTPPGRNEIASSGLAAPVAGFRLVFSLAAVNADHARQALHDELLSKTVDELDQLATHYRVEDTQVEAVNVTVMDATRIEFLVSGYVECQFQYGSDADVRRLNDEAGLPYTAVVAALDLTP